MMGAIATICIVVLIGIALLALFVLGDYGRWIHNGRMFRRLFRAKTRADVADALLHNGIEQDED